MDMTGNAGPPASWAAVVGDVPPGMPFAGMLKGNMPPVGRAKGNMLAVGGALLSLPSAGIRPAGAASPLRDIPIGMKPLPGVAPGGMKLGNISWWGGCWGSIENKGGTEPARWGIICSGDPDAAGSGNKPE